MCHVRKEIGSAASHLGRINCFENERVATLSLHSRTSLGVEWVLRDIPGDRDTVSGLMLGSGVP